MDKLRAMALFCRTVEAKSFAAAARSLDLVPSALSKAIAGLETELGTKLMNRSTRKHALTEQGSAYYEDCRQILRDLQAAEETCREGSSSPKGTLRVGLHPGFRAMFMRSMGGFLDTFPEIRIETVITNSPAAVMAEALDLVIHIGRLADSSLVSRRLGWALPVTCASPAYLAGWGEPRHPGELLKHRAVIYGRHDEERNTRWTFVRRAERTEVYVPVSMVSRDGIGLIDAAIGGCGIARPFDIAARSQIAAEQLTAVLRDWAGERQPICAVTPSNSSRDTARVRAYLEFVRSVLG